MEVCRKQYTYSETKTENHSRSGNTLTLKGNWQYRNSGMCERWDDENRVLEVSDRYLTNENAGIFSYTGI